MNTHNPETYRFFLMTLDPVHIGTGGMCLGRVDNPIVREPGTRLPKIPGTALHGAIRQYAARRYGKTKCAGQKGHCGRATCPVCYTFGTIEGEGGSFSGVVSIGDARILLFPVYSMVGPVWVTSPDALYDAGLDKHEVSPDKAKWGGEQSELPTDDKPINLGWLMVEREDDLPNISWPSQIPPQIQNRVVLVSDKLFLQIVNSNLEVRTSVSINPETGTAEEGALFTYEAIPRATVMLMEVVVDDFREAFPNKERWQREYTKEKEASLSDEMPDDITDVEKSLRRLGYIDNRPKLPKENDSQAQQRYHEEVENYWLKVKEAFASFKRAVETLDWSDPGDVVHLGLEWAEHLGVGGMGTRGFGRIRTLCWEIIQDGKPVEQCTKPKKASSFRAESG